MMFARHRFTPLLDVAPAPLSVAPLVQLCAAADERQLYKYVTQSFKVFEQAVFAEACEKSATARGRSEDAEPGEKSGRYPQRDAPLLSKVSDAMVARLRAGMIEFERLEETVDR